MSKNAPILEIGSSATELDIQIKINNTLANVFSNTFRIFDASDILQISGTAINVSTGIYTASGTIPSGTLGTWKILWDIIHPSGAVAVTFEEEFCVNATNLAVSFERDVEDTGKIFPAVRIDLGDIEGTILSDSLLRKYLNKAIIHLNRALNLTRIRPGTEGVGITGRILPQPITVNLQTGDVTPDNDEFLSLIILQMEYIILIGEANALKRLHLPSAGSLGAGFDLAQREGLEVVNADGVKIKIDSSRFRERAAMHRFTVEQIKEDLDMAIKTFLYRHTSGFGRGVI